MTTDRWIDLLAAIYFGGILIWGLGCAFLKGADVLFADDGVLLMLAASWPIVLLVGGPLWLAYWLGTQVARYRRRRNSR